MPRAVLKLQPDPAMLRVARMVLGAAARQRGADENLIDDIQLGATEAVKQAIDVHRSAGTDELVVIEFDFGADTFAVQVAYAAPRGRCPDETPAAVDRMGVIAGIADDAEIECDATGLATISMRWMQADTRS